LNCARDMDQVFVDHRDKGDVVLGCQVAKDAIEGIDVFLAIVGRQGDAGEQDFNVRAFERGQHLVEVAAGLVGGQTAEAVVAAEFDDDDFGVQEQDGAKACNGVLGGGAAGTLIVHLVVVASAVEIPL